MVCQPIAKEPDPAVCASDFIIEHGGKLTPIEVKWTEKPSETDTGHLRAFMKEHPQQVNRAYIICRCSRPLEICERVTALPWFCL